jgi:hypothetical protein
MASTGDSGIDSMTFRLYEPESSEIGRLAARGSLWHESAATESVDSGRPSKKPV